MSPSTGGAGGDDGSPRAPLLVIGKPVHQSMSPALFRWLYVRAGLRGELAPRVVADASGVAAVVDDLRRGTIGGFCITAPLKELALTAVDRVDAAAELCGAVNWVVRTPVGEVIGSNTDVDGVRFALADAGVRDAQAPKSSDALAPVDRAAIVLGAGGATRAAVVALAKLGVSRIIVANRTVDKAAALVSEFTDASDAKRDGGVFSNVRLQAIALTSAALAPHLAAAELVVNATSCGLNSPGDDPLPNDLALSDRHTVLDMVYRPLHTALLIRALAGGARVVDGLSMLVHQAISGFELVEAQAAAPGLLPGLLPRAFAAELHAHLLTSCIEGDLDIGDPRAFILAGRTRINEIDRTLIRLLASRFAAAKRIGEVKAALGEPVVRPERERALRALHDRWTAEVNAPGDVVTRVFDSILDASRRAQSEQQRPPSLRAPVQREPSSEDAATDLDKAKETP